MATSHAHLTLKPDPDPARAYLQGARQQPAPTCVHRTYGGSVCALCGQEVTEAPSPTEPTSPQAFRDGERLAYDRVLAFLASLPEDLAGRSRDQGRGVASVVRDLTTYVTTLRDDL
jgi:hypothetical protein